MCQRSGYSKPKTWSVAILLTCLIGISACSSSNDNAPANDDLDTIPTMPGDLAYTPCISSQDAYPPTNDNPGTIPTMPGDLTSTVYSTHEVELFWTASTDDGWVMGYDIFRDGIPVANLLDASSFFEGTLAPSTTYLYRVSAVDDDANRSLSVELFVTTGDSEGGSASGQVIAAEPTMTPVRAKTFRFSWIDIANATHYKLLENSDGNSGFTQIYSDLLPSTECIDHVVPLYARSNAQYILQTCVSNQCVDSSVISVSGTLDMAIGYIKPSEFSNYSVVLSADGKTMAIGDYRERSVYVYTRFGSQWNLQSHLTLGDGVSSSFGDGEVSLSADGNRLAVVVDREVDIYVRIKDEWIHETRIAAVGYGFGHIISLSADGNTVAVGSFETEAVSVYSRDNGSWDRRAYLKISDTTRDDWYGHTVSLSADGRILAVGAPGFSMDTTDGTVYTFALKDGSWIRQAEIKASNPDNGDSFGGDISLSADGNTLAVGAVGESSNARGVNGNQHDNSAFAAGAVYVFSRQGGDWTQQVYLKSSNHDQGDTFGHAVSLSADGNTLAIGATNERSNATGVNGDQDDNTVEGSGAVYLFTRRENTWWQTAYLKAKNGDEYDYFGDILTLSADGDTLAVGASQHGKNHLNTTGTHQFPVFRQPGAVYLY